MVNGKTGCSKHNTWGVVVSVFFVLVMGTTTLWSARTELPKMDFTVTVPNAPKIDKPATHQEALPGILKNTAAYCNRLKKKVFHFFCFEKVREKYSMVAHSGKYAKLRSQKRNQSGAIKREYISEYQIIQTSAGIKEKRKLVKYNGRKLKMDKRPPALKSILYSYKNALAPISLLSEANQPKYQYRLLGKSRVMKRNAYLLEVRPKQAVRLTANPVLVVVWVDDSKYSILKFQVFPAGFKGYHYLQRSGSGKLSDVTVNDIHYFGEVHDGLRFPSKTEIRLTYKHRDFRPSSETTSTTRKYNPSSKLNYKPEVYKPKKEIKRIAIDYHTKLHTTYNYKHYLFYDVKVEDPVFK